MELSQLCDIALEGARLATEVHRRHLGRIDESDWAEKGLSDFVSRVDREAEARVIEHLGARCPGHEVMAEESTDLEDADAVRSRLQAAEWLWILDPLDGTTNYLHRYPAYAASLAVAHRGEVVAGAVVDGTTGRAWTAWRNGGAFLDGERIAVSRIERMDRSLIGTGFPFKVLHLLPAYLAQFDGILRRTAGVRRAGSAALDLCHVASGWLDGFWELWLAPWDVAAGTLMVREAGGRVTTQDGDPDVRRAGSIVAGNPAIHARLLEFLASPPPSASGEQP